MPAAPHGTPVSILSGRWLESSFTSSLRPALPAWQTPHSVRGEPASVWAVVFSEGTVPRLQGMSWDRGVLTC